jgi:Uncharacterized protein conserved in bacteria (DUF2188)
MAIATYRIVPADDGWGIEHDGKISGHYLTKEAAFEAAVGPAANAIKEGLAVAIQVPGKRAGEAALGS